MEDKELQKRSVRNKNVRNILLGSIIVLFITFVVFFIFSYIQYKSIQNKIQNIYTAVNSDQNNFTELLKIFNDAEDHFRIFSTTYNIDDYDAYRENLILLKSAVDSLLQTKGKEVADDFDSSYAGRTLEDLMPKYDILSSKLDSMLLSSEQLKTFNLESSDESIFDLPPIKSHTLTTIGEPKKVVVKRKPLL